MSTNPRLGGVSTPLRNQTDCHNKVILLETLTFDTSTDVNEVPPNTRTEYTR